MKFRIISRSALCLMLLPYAEKACSQTTIGEAPSNIFVGIQAAYVPTYFYTNEVTFLNNSNQPVGTLWLNANPGSLIMVQNTTMYDQFQGSMIVDGSGSFLYAVISPFVAFPTTVSNNAQIYSGTMFGPTYFNGGILVSNGNGTVSSPIYLGPGSWSSMGYQSNPAITFNTNGYSTTILSAITGPGSLTKTGQGTLTLAGPVTGLTSTTISAGTMVIAASFQSQTITVQSGGSLRVNGTITSGSTLTLQPNASISGNGQIGDLTIGYGGVLAPGNSIGRLTATGNVTLLPGSIYLAEVNGRGDSDFHAISGLATIDGSTVQVKPHQGGVFGKNTSYPILSASGGLTGRFGAISDHFALLDSSLSYTTNDVNLTLSRNANSFASLARTNNQLAVSQSLDVAEDQGQAQSLLGTIYGFSEAEARGAYNSLSGEGIADVRGVASSASNLFLSSVRDQMIFGGVRSFTPTATMRVWATMLGGNLQLSSRDGYAGMMTQVWGGAGGIEKQFDLSLKAGVAVGGTSSNLSVSGLQTNGQVSFGHAALYGQKDFSAAYLLAAVGWSAGQSSTKRTISLFGGLQTGSFNGQGPNGRLEAGYRLRWGAVDVTPYAAIQGAWINQSGMREQGDPLGSLYVKGQNVSSVPGSLGVQVKTSYALDQGWDLGVRGRAAYVHDFTPSRSIKAQISGLSQSFVASGMPSPANAVDLGVGIELLSTSGFSASLVADTLLAEKAVGWRGQLTLGYTW